MSQLSTILERIADIEIGISVPGLDIPYVLQAEPYQPSDMSSVSCPFFVNELNLGPNPARLPVSAGQQHRETFVTMMLCVARKEANIDLKYGVKETTMWADAVFATFAQHRRLSAPAKLINSSTNTSPITVVTAVPHRFQNGDPVTVSGHLINTNLNGAWIATVVDDNTFTVPGVGNGIGAQSGYARETQPVDLSSVVTATITQWSPAVPYEYGSTTFLAIAFMLRVVEMYVQTIEP